jgi:hypothetical protein
VAMLVGDQSVFAHRVASPSSNTERSQHVNDNEPKGKSSDAA